MANRSRKGTRAALLFSTNPPCGFRRGNQGAGPASTVVAPNNGPGASAPGTKCAPARSRQRHQQARVSGICQNHADSSTSGALAPVKTANDRSGLDHFGRDCFRLVLRDYQSTRLETDVRAFFRILGLQIPAFWHRNRARRRLRAASRSLRNTPTFFHWFKFRHANSQEIPFREEIDLRQEIHLRDEQTEAAKVPSPGLSCLVADQCAEAGQCHARRSSSSCTPSH